MTPDRIPPATLGAALIFFLFALKSIQALTAEDINTLYTRFVVNMEDENYWRAWWDGLRQVYGNTADIESLRLAMLSQIQRTEWRKLYFQPDIHANSVVNMLSYAADFVKDYTASASSDAIALVKTIQYLLREAVVHNIDDFALGSSLADVAVRLFSYYPPTAEDRNHLAEMLFTSSSCGSESQRLGDFQLLRAFLLADTSETVPDWNKEDCVSMLCRNTPSLPELIFDELSSWKQKQYLWGFETPDRPVQIQVRLQLLMSVLAWDKSNFAFSRELLEKIWLKLFTTSADVEDEQRYWGGDIVTETIRSVFFHVLVSNELRRHSGLVYSFKNKLILGR